MPPRVLQITNSLAIGGLERVVTDLTCLLHERGIESEVLCLAEGGPLEDELRVRGVPIRILHKRPGGRPGALAAVASCLLAGRFDVVHTHNTGPLLYGMPAAWLTGISMRVHTEHGRIPAEQRGRGLRRAECWALGRCSHVVAVSSPGVEALRRDTGFLGAIGIVHNGYAPAHLVNRTQARASLGIPDGVPVMAVVGRLAVEKGQDLALRALAALGTGEPNLVLVLVGDGPERNALEALAGQLGLSGRVLFTGARPDVRQLYQAFDLVLLPSRSESLPMVLLEAGTAGVPVLATRVGGMPEVVEDGETGLLVPPEDPAALAAAAKRILLRPEWGGRLAAGLRERVQRQFSATAMVAGYVKLYVGDPPHNREAL